MKLVFNAAKLGRLRILAGLSRRELAKRIGTTERAVQYWENERSAPRPKYVKKLASVFHVSQRELYLEGEMSYGNATAD